MPFRGPIPPQILRLLLYRQTEFQCQCTSINNRLSLPQKAASYDLAFAEWTVSSRVDAFYACKHFWNLEAVPKCNLCKYTSCSSTNSWWPAHPSQITTTLSPLVVLQFPASDLASVQSTSVFWYSLNVCANKYVISETATFCKQKVHQVTQDRCWDENPRRK